METLRGNYGSLSESDYDPSDDDAEREAPPAIGTDERRMQVRAYNHWASLLADRNFPAIEDLEPANLPDFGPYSVLLDFTGGIENPGIAYLGGELAQECGASAEQFETLADVPSRSLLSRITDHYMQILANQAPIGFEAEFVNERGQTVLYRGILLPFSSDDDTIDFIYGVINWKELAGQQAADELLLEMDQALESEAALPLAADPLQPLTDWADGPGSAAEDVDLDLAGTDGGADILPHPTFGYDEGEALSFGDETAENDNTEEPEASEEQGPKYGSLLKTPVHLGGAAPSADAFDDAGQQPAVKRPIQFEGVADEAFGEDDFASADVPGVESLANAALSDWLASAQEMAAAAHASEDRTRGALYRAIGRAYDFSLMAAQQPEEFAELVADAGLTMQARAPLTPVVKLVFGADYDKTRLTEYAAALSHAYRLDLPQGALGEYLAEAPGGLKAVVKEERRLRREESGKAEKVSAAPAQKIAKKLRTLPAQDFIAIAPDGSEFALLMIRRTDVGEVVMLGEVPEDAALVEKAGRRLIG